MYLDDVIIVSKDLHTHFSQSCPLPIPVFPTSFPLARSIPAQLSHSLSSPIHSLSQSCPLPIPVFPTSFHLALSIPSQLSHSLSSPIHSLSQSCPLPIPVFPTSFPLARSIPSQLSHSLSSPIHSPSQPLSLPLLPSHFYSLPESSLLPCISPLHASLFPPFPFCPPFVFLSVYPRCTLPLPPCVFSPAFLFFILISAFFLSPSFLPSFLPSFFIHSFFSLLSLFSHLLIV